MASAALPVKTASMNRRYYLLLLDSQNFKITEYLNLIHKTEDVNWLDSCFPALMKRLHF